MILCGTMKISKTNFLMLSGVLIVIAAVVLAFSMAGRQSEEDAAAVENTQPVPQRGTQRRVSSPSPALSAADVVRMTPQDWADRFQKSRSEVSAEYEEEILTLAKELAEILSQDPNPNGVEAMVFADAILTLLAEGRRPE